MIEIYLCDGEYKIAKYDSLNWTIRKKSKTGAKEYYNKKSGRKQVKNADGYQQYKNGVYFKNVEEACAYALKHIVLEEKDANSLEEIIKAIESAEAEVRKAVKEAME